MKILHTESSKGWGGQEIRILKEAEGMRHIGHEIIIVVNQGGGLALEARKKGFIVYELNLKKRRAFILFFQLYKIIKKHQIDLVNTHSSLDAWICGIMGKIMKKKVIRTRHLSTDIKKGLNSFLLYNYLVDFVVTTCSAVIPKIISQSKISPNRCKCIPTGVNPSEIIVDQRKTLEFREQLALKPGDCLVGTACFVRSWKGIKDLMRAASMMREVNNLKWVIIGGGYVEEYKGFAKELKLENILFYTGHLSNPFNALAALDIFTLLSTAHEGISQASLQAAYLQKPLIMTSVGGLPEVCIDKKTGFLIPPFSPDQLVLAVRKLLENPDLGKQMGQKAKHLVEEKYTFAHTLVQMQQVYSLVQDELL